MMTIDELDKHLCEKYPKLFRDRHGDMRKTCMVWGLEIGPGWANILESLCANIQWHIDQSRNTRLNNLKYNRALVKAKNGDNTALKRYFSFDGATEFYIQKHINEALALGKPRNITAACPQVIVTQVKEKFGSLRFYYNGGDSMIDGMVRMAERLSEVTCDDCGSPGEATNEAWISVRCKKHRKNYFVDENSVEP